MNIEEEDFEETYKRQRVLPTGEENAMKVDGNATGKRRRGRPRKTFH
jgi:hypothetical protein